MTDIQTSPHRRKLDRKRVANLQMAIAQHGNGGTFGAAVAYQAGQGYVVLGGEHRVAAAVANGQRELEVYVLRSWLEFVAWMAVDKTDPRALLMDTVTAVYLLDKARAALRPAREDRPTADLAEFIGVHLGILENVIYARQVAEDASELPAVRAFAAQRLEEQQESSDGGHGLRTAINRVRDRTLQANQPRLSAVKQRSILGDAVATLTGMVSGLEALGELNDDLAAEERAEWATQLGKINTKISQLKNKLRESK